LKSLLGQNKILFFIYTYILLTVGNRDRREKSRKNLQQIVMAALGDQSDAPPASHQQAMAASNKPISNIVIIVGTCDVMLCSIFYSIGSS